MRVGFNARYLRHPSRRGFNRYTWSLARALARLDGVEVVLISDTRVDPSFLDGWPAEVVVETASRHLWWEQMILPRLIRRLGLDVFHAPASVGLPFRKECAYVLTILDVIGLAVPHLLPRAPRAAQVHHWTRERVSLLRADAVLTVSEHSRRDIVRWLGVAPKRITVIPLGADEQFRVIESMESVCEGLTRYGLGRGYVLYVGGFDRRKNVASLIDAYGASRAAKDADLVLVGEMTPEAAELMERARGRGVESRTRFLGYVPDEDLPALYNGAAVFVYPSLYEGFGLQLAEAMACGVPVIASDRTSLPEVLRGAGMLVDPENSGQIAEAIDAVVFDADAAARLGDAGRKVAAGLSWERVALRTLDVYRTVVGRAS